MILGTHIHHLLDNSFLLAYDAFLPQFSSRVGMMQNPSDASTYTRVINRKYIDTSRSGQYTNYDGSYVITKVDT